MWADLYKRWCDLCCWWLPKVGAEQPSGGETNEPEATTDKSLASPEAAEDTPGSTLGAAGSDDLTVIKGIGPAMKKKLASFGIASVADLAASDPEDLATKLHGSSATRIKGWIGVAQDRIVGS